MNIIQIYRRFPSENDCIKHLEAVRWNSEPSCPYCSSKNKTTRSNTQYHHCNGCNRDYTVTVGTIFHKTHCPLQKWFLAITLILNAKKGYAGRQLARDIEVTKDTAWRIFMKIRSAMTERDLCLYGIIEADETFVGGKNKNRHSNKRIKGTQGRSPKDKIPVLGALQRSTGDSPKKVYARSSLSTCAKAISEFLKPILKAGTELMTDEHKAYISLGKLFDHKSVKHKGGQYVEEGVHTNTIEGFWSLFKRGIIGQFHHLTKKHIDKYLAEFCFRYNNRNNKSAFELVISNALKTSINTIKTNCDE